VPDVLKVNRSQMYSSNTLQHREKSKGERVSREKERNLLLESIPRGKIIRNGYYSTKVSNKRPVRDEEGPQLDQKSNLMKSQIPKLRGNIEIGENAELVKTKKDQSYQSIKSKEDSKALKEGETGQKGEAIQQKNLIYEPSAHNQSLQKSRFDEIRPITHSLEKQNFVRLKVFYS
jgi:hypothetical protein